MFQTQLQHPTSKDEMQTTQTLKQIIAGAWITQGIYVVAQLGIADLLKDGSKSYDELATKTGVDARSLYRLLRALASVGIFAEGNSGYFELTPVAESLQSDRTDSLRGYAIKSGQAWEWQPWGHLLESIKTGKPVFKNIFGMERFDYLATDPSASKIYTQAISSISGEQDAAIAAGYDFSFIHNLVEVGGGNGTLIASILKSNLTMQGILFDLPHVVADAKPVIEDLELQDRCQLVGGNFFESVPTSGDAYLLRYIIHDWDDERAIAILKNCYQAMQPDGRLLLVEMVIPQGNEPFFGKLLDLQMLVNYGGRERTQAEYQVLLKTAGFSLTKIYPVAPPISIIEAIRL
ncbi:methyltransferase [Nostoc punctiforme]|uniref:O-methyltransferase, family 2 n=1 Tax=Nostoc punctiforme (strain ATCC 29133 / PCC 73102) TaxID=63737 RepID=B2IX79_NOSP7|nr:methyltransferase [Nostoc punctiforme]ACC84614.1 O-methyltransferase, family 2 [Nostoc punctiforme PCC 73102]